MSVPIRMKQLGLKDSKRPSSDDNKGFKGNKKATFHNDPDWKGTVKGKTKHTYGAND